MNGSGHSHGSGHNAGRSQQHHGQHNTQAYQQQRMSMHNVAPQAAAQVPIDMNYPTYAYGHPHAHYSYDPSAMNMNVRNPADVHSYGYYIPAVSAVPTADVSQLSAHNVYGQLNDQEWAEHVFSSMKAQAQAQAQAQYMGGLNLGVGVGGLVTPPHGGYSQRQSIPSKRSDGTQNGQDGSTAVADAQSGGAVSVAPKIDERSMDPNQQQSMYYATQMGVSGYVPYGSNAQDPQAQAQLMNNINVNHGHGMHSTFMPPLQNYYAAFPASLGLGSVFPASYIDQQNQTFGAVYPAASAPTAVPITVPVQPSVVPVTTAAQAPATSTVPASSPAAATPAAAPSASVTPETKLSQTTQNQSPPVETKVSPVIESFADLTLAATPALSASSAAVTDVPPVEAPAPQPEAQARKPFSYADALANPARKILPVVPKPAAPAPPAPAPTTVRSGGSPRSVSASGSSNVRPQTSSTSSSQRPSTSTNPATRRADLPGTNPGPNAFNSSPSKARCFVIKSYSADDIHKSIKYGVWASTEHGNRRLDGAFRESAGTVPVYLFFSVNGSGCFCGMAQMMSAVDYSKAFGAWAQSEKWPGQFKVKWIFIKNLPNREVRHITLPNNSNKPVTNSRDTQEIPLEQALQLLKVYHSFRHKNSILDDFDYFDQEEEKRKQQPAAASESDSGKDGPATDSSAAPSTPTPPSAGTAQPGRAPAKA